MGHEEPNEFCYHLLVWNLTFFAVFVAGTVKPSASRFPHADYKANKFQLLLDGEVLKSPGYDCLRVAELESNSMKRMVIEKQKQIIVNFQQITFEIIS